MRRSFVALFVSSLLGLVCSGGHVSNEHSSSSQDTELKPIPKVRLLRVKRKSKILATAAVVAAVGAVALAPVTGGQSLWGFAWAF